MRSEREENLDRLVVHLRVDIIKLGKMKEVNKKLSVLLIALWSVALLNCVSAMKCPDKCSCQQRTVRCVRQQLKLIPELPVDTNIM